MQFKHDFPFDPSYGYTQEMLLKVPPPPEPPGFVHFWKNTYRAAMEIPLRLESKKIVSAVPGFECYEIHFDSWEGVRIGGWVTVPANGVFHRGIVVGHGYGGRDAPDYWPDAATVSICARGFQLSEHPCIPNNAAEHVVVGIQSRETYVHRGCVVDFWLAASALLALYPAAAQQLYFRGGSFGGGIGAHVMAWDARFHRGVLVIPSFGQYPLRVQLPCVGSGEAVRQIYLRRPEVLDVLAYYDSASAARHIAVPMLVAPALFDPAVAPPGQFAIANATPEPRELVILTLGHFPHRIEIEEGLALEKRIARFFVPPTS